MKLKMIRFILFFVTIYGLVSCEKPNNEKVNQLNKSGGKIGEWYYLNANKDTLKKEFYDKNSSLLLEKRYVGNIEVLETYYDMNEIVKKIQFYPNKAIRSIISYEKPNRYREETFFENGKTKTIINYLDERMVDEFVQFHENGEVYFKAESIVDGKGYVYDSLGSLKRVVLLKNYLVIDTLQIF